MSEVTAETLDESQYRRESVEAYEAIYGRDFVSPGGIDTARRLIARLDLSPGERVLDVGCGLGGSAFLMAKEAGVQVEGMDLSRNMIAMAHERMARHGLGDRVRLVHGDCLQLDPLEPFDALYSREVFLHIHDKPGLFAALARSLRPGGRLLVTDYCSGPAPWDEEFTAYVEQRGYDLRGVDEYAGLLRAAGFQEIRSEDLTDEFLAVHRDERRRLSGLDLDAPRRQELAEGWDAKIARASRGDQRWGLFLATWPGP